MPCPEPGDWMWTLRQRRDFPGEGNREGCTCPSDSLDTLRRIQYTFQEGTGSEGRWTTAWLHLRKSPGSSAFPGTSKVPEIKAVATPWVPNGAET